MFYYNAYVGNLRESEYKHEKDHTHGELKSPGPEIFGPIVHESHNQRFQYAKLRVESESQKHHKEEDTPKRRWAQLENDLKTRKKLKKKNPAEFIFVTRADKVQNNFG